MPRDPKSLFKVSEYTYSGDLSQRAEVWDSIEKFNQALPLESEEQEIIKLIGNLINGVTELKALEELRNIL